MTDIGQWFYDLLQPLGTVGLLLCIFILFYIDAIIFPTLPELFTIIIYGSNPTLPFAVEMLITIAIAEVLGFTTLYFIVKKVRVPSMVQKAVEKYTNFLFVNDELIILVNRVAPILPFVGAFAAVKDWSYKRCILYTVIGGTIKYGFIIAMGAVIYSYLDSGTATTVTIIVAIAIMAFSFFISYRKRQKILVPKIDPPSV